MDQELIWDSLYKKDSQKWKLESKLPKIFKDKVVLEIGAGNGKTLKSILIQKPKEVHAIDSSIESINILKKQFSDKNNIIIEKVNLLDLPYEENKFDIVVCFFVLNNLLKEDREKAILQINKVLKSSGIIIFSDFGKGDYRLWSSNDGQEVEENTIIKSNGLIFHTFTLEEAKSLFSSFTDIKSEMISSTPIRKNQSLIRKRIYLEAKKL